MSRAAITALLAGWLTWVATAQADGDGTCPTNYKLVGSKCYFVSPHSDSKAYTAPFYCDIQGGTLSVLKSFQEILLLRRSALLGMTTYVISANITGFARDQGYRESTNMGFNPLAPFPSELTDEDCVAVDAAENLRWRKVDCGTKHAVLCEAAITGSLATPTPKPVAEPTSEPEPPLYCPEGARRKGSHCYWRGGSQTYTFAEAQQACRAREMELPSVHSQEENIFIQGRADSKWSWLGLKKDAGDSRYSWTDGTALDYEKWASGSPSDVSFDCAAVEWDAGTWRDLPCATPLGLLCKSLAQTTPVVVAVTTTPSTTPATTTTTTCPATTCPTTTCPATTCPTTTCPTTTCPTTTPTTTTPRVPSCPRGAHKLHNSCFHTNTEKFFTNHQARGYCTGLGMQLASVHSQEENDLLRGLLVNKRVWGMWIGLGDAREEGVYEWADGTQRDYTNWRASTDEPSTGSDADCAVMYGRAENNQGSWGDYWCHHITGIGVACRGRPV